jgi:opacity protein-like surface antigen/outer membrane protease
MSRRTWSAENRHTVAPLNLHPTTRRPSARLGWTPLLVFLSFIGGAALSHAQETWPPGVTPPAPATAAATPAGSDTGDTDAAADGMLRFRGSDLDSGATGPSRPWLDSQEMGADLPVTAQPTVPFSWTGFYGGAHVGAALGFSGVTDPHGASIFGDTIRTPGFLAGGQAGYNWQAPDSNVVWGIEANLSWLDAQGTSTCFATTAPVGAFGTGMITSSNCRARPDFTGALTGRVGLATGLDGHTLLFVKGGPAILHNRVDATTNFGFDAFPFTTTGAAKTSWGFTVGAGVEQAIAPAWSVKLEYDYLKFADLVFTSPSSFSTTNAASFAAVPGRTVSVQQDMHLVMIGLNYHFNSNAAFTAAPPPAMTGGWGFETGGRYWYSSGRFQKDLPGDSTKSLALISRLTYNHLTANTGETFARLDTPWNVFLKGLVGLGKTTGGRMNDEDWGLITRATTAYSNTLSGLADTHVNYATIDLGYDFLHGPDYKVGAFVGWNHVYERYAATDCTQIASPPSGICSPPISGVPVITETDRWNSLRLGAATELWLTPKVKLTGDAAYLPYVKFTGVDNHWLRDLVIDESGHGQGVQLELIASYYFTPHVSVGLGGRYWAMWTTTGKDAFNGEPIPRSDTFRYERWGGFLQATYKFK